MSGPRWERAGQKEEESGRSARGGLVPIITDSVVGEQHWKRPGRRFGCDRGMFGNEIDVETEMPQRCSSQTI